MSQTPHRALAQTAPVLSLADIEAPIFAVATEWDHVAPWQSVSTRSPAPIAPR